MIYCPLDCFHFSTLSLSLSLHTLSLSSLILSWRRESERARNPKKETSKREPETDEGEKEWVHPHTFLPALDSDGKITSKKWEWRGRSQVVNECVKSGGMERTGSLCPVHFLSKIHETHFLPLPTSFSLPLYYTFFLSFSPSHPHPKDGNHTQNVSHTRQHSFFYHHPCHTINRVPCYHRLSSFIYSIIIYYVLFHPT